MYNPFVKLVKEGEDPSTEETGDELLHREERTSPDDKEKELTRLREWRAQVEAGMKSEPHSDDPEQLDKIDELIRKIEQQ